MHEYCKDPCLASNLLIHCKAVVTSSEMIKTVLFATLGCFEECSLMLLSFDHW